MIPVVIQYHTFFFRRLIPKRITSKLPSSWADVDENLIRRLIKFLSLKINDELADASLIFHLLNIPIRVFRKLRRSDIIELSRKLIFLTEDAQIKKVLIPKINTRLRKYYGPIGWLDNTVYIEYAFAEKFYNDYTQGDKHALNSMIACLYRPSNIFIRIARLFSMRDIRKRFTKDTVEKRAIKIKSLSEETKQVILFNYVGMRNLIVIKYKHVFKKRDDLIKTGVSDHLGIMIDIAGDKFGTIDQTMYARLHLVMKFLEKSELDRIAHEREMERIRTK